MVNQDEGLNSTILTTVFKRLARLKKSRKNQYREILMRYGQLFELKAVPVLKF